MSIKLLRPKSQASTYGLPPAESLPQPALACDLCQVQAVALAVQVQAFLFYKSQHRPGKCKLTIACPCEATALSVCLSAFINVLIWGSGMWTSPASYL